MRLSRDELPSIAPEAGLLWDASLADHMEQYLRNGITNPPQQLILTILIRNDLRRARTLLQSWLAAPNIREQPDQAATAAAVLLDHDPDEGLSTFLTLTRDHPQLAQQAILARDSYTASVVPPGDPNQLADLYIWLVRHFPPAEDPNIEEAHRVSRREETGQWRDAILSRLTNDGDPRTPDAIRRIATQVPSERWLDQAEAAAQEAVRRAQWTPVAIGQLRRLATEKTTTLVRNAAELQHVVVEALNDIQQLLQGANPQAHWLWDTTAQRPKEEDDLSDYLQAQLTSLIGGRGVVVNREVQVRRTARRGVGQRVDLHVAAADASSGRPLVVVVEVKAAWNTELYTAMNDQLTRRYLADVDSRHGIYCVGWYSTEKWSAQTGSCQAG